MPEQPPKKRLKLSVRPPARKSIDSTHSNESAQSDTIVVSTRPRRSATLNKRYSTDIQDEGINDNDTTSDLSSAPPTPPAAKDPHSSKTPSSAKLDYGAMFMATYLEGGADGADDTDDDGGKRDKIMTEPQPVKPDVEPKPQPPTNSKKRKPSRAVSQPALHDKGPVATHAEVAVNPMPLKISQSAASAQAHGVSPHNSYVPNQWINYSRPAGPGVFQYDPPAIRRPDPPAPVELPGDPATFATVDEMIHRLRNLHNELCRFGGAPPPPSSPGSDIGREPDNPLEDNNPLNPFLALFEDNASDTSDDTERRLMGEPDHALVFGVNFIMQALRSWASNRIEGNYAEAARHHFILLQQWQAAREHRQGRPKKVTDDPPPPAPPPIKLDSEGQYDLTGHPEAAVIAAFTAVIKSGALQLNAIIPRPLGRSLRMLYKQIDQLINRGVTRQREWRMFSYHAQIQAHAELVESVKIQHIQAQQLMAQSHMDNQRRIMQNMGLSYLDNDSPINPPRPGARVLTKEQDEWHRTVEIERKRNSQHARAQPYLHQQHLHPMQFQPLNSPSGAVAPIPMMPPRHMPRPLGGPQHFPQPNEMNGNGFPPRPNVNQPNPTTMQALAEAHFGMPTKRGFMGPDPDSSQMPHSRSHSDGKHGGKEKVQRAPSKPQNLPPNSPSDPITITSSPIINDSASGKGKASAADASLLGALGIAPRSGPDLPPASAKQNSSPAVSNGTHTQAKEKRRSSGTAGAALAGNKPSVLNEKKKRGKRSTCEVVEIDDSS